MESDDYTFYFLSCTTNIDQINLLKHDKNIISIYRVCGIDPWLIVVKTNSLEEIIKLTDRYDMKIKYMSIVKPYNASPPIQTDNNVSDVNNKIILGNAVSVEEPDKVWDVEGRYHGRFLQMIYFPSHSAKNIDFLDYGCYFFDQDANGNFIGFSTGFGSDPQIRAGSISTDHHEMKRLNY
ncbi:MAG: hypothetical protein Q6360_16500 [Candidatus Brocadiales bacterium]|nr:hypothetical protein [Candidatus Brocadiales bacterium]